MQEEKLDQILVKTTENKTTLGLLESMIQQHVAKQDQDFAALHDKLDSKVGMRVFAIGASIITAIFAFFFISHVEITNSITALQ